MSVCCEEQVAGRVSSEKSEGAVAGVVGNWLA
jgi:hypothetical protein